MRIDVLLHSRDDAGRTATVQTSVDVATTGVAWASDLVDTVAAQAREGARHLVAELPPVAPRDDPPGFVPLAALLRSRG